MAPDTTSDDYMRERIIAIRSELPDCISEAGALVELARNAERTGVPADVRTHGRTRDLLGKVRGWTNEACEWENRTKSVPIASELRILKGTFSAMQAEVEIAAKAFRLEV